MSVGPATTPRRQFAPGAFGRPWTASNVTSRSSDWDRDRIQFRGGDCFAGNLVVDRVRGGTRDQPVVIGTYGKGRATLLAGGGTGIRIGNALGRD